MKWKTNKEIYDRRICEHRTKKGNVYESESAAVSPEEKLLRAIFGENEGVAYRCRICKKWHLAKNSS